MQPEIKFLLQSLFWMREKNRNCNQITRKSGAMTKFIKKNKMKVKFRML